LGGDLDEPADSVTAGDGSAGREPTVTERDAADSVLRMIWGIHVSRAVYVVSELGIADLLADGPQTAKAVAEATGTHEPSLYRVLRLLASLEVLTELPGRSFGLTILGERLRTDVPASMRSWARLVDSEGGVRAFEPIVETVRTGKPGVDLAHGMPVYEYLAQHPDLASGFNAAMSERTTGLAPSVAVGYDFSRMRTVADIGGGKGTLLAAILRVHSHLRGVLLDAPPVAAAAAEVLEGAGVADRCEIVAGDFFEEVPAGADGYILAYILHNWDDQRATQILRVCRGAMATGGRVLIVERLIPDIPEDALTVLLSDLNMLVFTGGQERTNAEYGQLLTNAGFILGKIHAVATPYGIVEGLS
jgi:hypothetical protein